ncbi:uncharacterized protein LOC110666129 isoform X2 [Hevea brasiliensis]|uniref:uncharacterized protein LOC110666129 isoform X2 n=1 Tax=Hevea brasiliensis TaxID=3981 RepID=UPI0025EAEDF8|nr:uncharacterized protein LOC110666129 isoform X2 [Hevea brasiliensis]
MPMATRSLNRIVATVMISSAALSLTPKPAFANLTHPVCPDSISFDAKEKMKTMGYQSYFTIHRYGSAQKGNEMPNEEVKCRNSIVGWFKVISGNYKCPTDDLVSNWNESNFGDFPVNEEGLVKKALVDWNYKDLDVENKYKVRINFVLYNDTQSTVYNSSEQDPSPAVVHLCDDGTPYGPAFNRAIEGMRAGGIRRIIFPRNCAPRSLEPCAPNIKAYGVMDVELVAVCASPVCC